jgi:glycosyltransferase involved in cell wall biosynthesis
MLSFVIPAFNEEAVLGDTLRAVFAAAGAAGEPFEVIVVDDASTDRTAEVARSAGAAVVPVRLRKIAAVRNAGARAARGDVLVFVDADTLLSAEVVAGVLAALKRGAVGGGARVRMEGAGVPFWGRALTAAVTWAFYRLQLTGGCFVYARRDAFEAVGGFDEAYYASEEVHLARALKRRGRFVVVPAAVTTSGRKFRMFSARQFLTLAARVVTGGRSALTRRTDLGMWYDGQREPPGSGRANPPHPSPSPSAEPGGEGTERA